MPGIDEPPGLEFIDGKVVAKVAAQKYHSTLQLELCQAWNAFARPRKLGRAFVELRCTFAGRSILPDVAFLLRKNILLDDRGHPAEETPIPPDIHVEVISPDRRVKRSRDKLAHSIAHGAGLGLLIHPYRQTVEAYRPGSAPETLPKDGEIVGDPVLPGFRLPASELFDWLDFSYLDPEPDAS